ncbi:MAG: rhodanese-like domain-containing protein [Sediminibacterium sp.]|nr:rhodanese-like domain-containing protein [Sediminibacterium sp.]MDP1811629.1 rhodanese-like domain-containing protein [Sediminibacterium sp.]MDP3127387.1 rhodanese-like domain-containing protein [Sediminibacterium sp.]MDP3665250.1 rhodanese-like domain-containing protein [Sediminibacterium sp.]
MGLFQNLFGGGQTADLKIIIEQGAFLVDVREPGEFADGTAKGAVNIPLGSVATQLVKFKGKDSIVVFCRSGNRSGQAKTILEQNGFKNIVNGGTWENVNQFVK